jgi:hypothetical protein
MEKKPFLKRLFYRYEPKGEVEKSGKTYYRYTRVPRFSGRKIGKILLYLFILILAFLTFVALDTIMNTPSRKYKKKAVLSQKEADYVQDLCGS